jgi:hypothetical protein
MIFQADENTTLPNKNILLLRKIYFNLAILPMQRWIRCRSINKVSGGNINIHCLNSKFFNFYLIFLRITANLLLVYFINKKVKNWGF